MIAAQRDRAFVVSKVEADQVTGDAMARACEASLARLGTDHLDLYLLHWRTPTSEFSEVVAGFENLRAAGKIRAWGVSNFTVPQLESLFQIPQGDRCATNQVLYNLGDRGIEHDLLPWCEQHGVAVMAYSPLGGLGANLLGDTQAHCRGTRLLGGRSCAGLGYPWRSCYCNSRIRLRRACKGERRRALADIDIPGISSAGSVSALNVRFS